MIVPHFWCKISKLSDLRRDVQVQEHGAKTPGYMVGLTLLLSDSMERERALSDPFQIRVCATRFQCEL